MDKNIIKLIISERQAEIERFKLVERPMTFDATMNYVLIGIRRSGKSCLMIQDMQKRIKAQEKSSEDFLYVGFTEKLQFKTRANCAWGHKSLKMSARKTKQAEFRARQKEIPEGISQYS